MNKDEQSNDFHFNLADSSANESSEISALGKEQRVLDSTVSTSEEESMSQPPEDQPDKRLQINEESDSGYAILRIPFTRGRIASIANQKVGESFSLILSELQPYFSTEVEELPPGLDYDPITRSLSGTPQTAGTFRLRFVAFEPGKDAELIELGLTIVPDPRTLWKNLPADKNAPFWKPDYAAEVDSTQNIFAVAASNRGRSHAHEGKFREDDFSMICVGPSTWTVLAVGDGGGSYPLSRRGSELATKVAAKRLATLLETHVTPLLNNYEKPIANIQEDREITNALYSSLIKASFEAAIAVKDEAERHGEAAKQFSTTLLLVAVKEFSIGHVVVGFNIGDGASGVLYNNGEELYLLCVPESGEFAGQTRFLATEEFAEENNQASRLRITVLDSFDAIAVMSDGVSDAKFPDDNSLHQAKYWHHLIFEDWLPEVLPDGLSKNINLPEPFTALKQRANSWLDYWALGTHDDRTLIIAFPKEANK